MPKFILGNVECNKDDDCLFGQKCHKHKCEYADCNNSKDCAGFQKCYGRKCVPVEAKNIVDVAVAAGNFKTLVQLVTDLDLVDTLRSQDAQTIFAPSDEAFAKLPEGTLESLTDKQAKAIVLRHVLGGITVPAIDVVTGPVDTLG